MRCLTQLRTSRSSLAAALLLNLSGCGDRNATNGSYALTDLLPSQLDEWNQQDSTVTYDRESIFEYINGAGEVYRSYAFSEVAVFRYSATDRSDVLVELFDMGNPNDAYGVFSYAREQEEPGIGGGYEHKGDVLCFWQNRYYVCLAMDDPTQDSETDLTTIARAISQHLPSPSVRPSLMSLFPEDGLVPLSTRFFHLHQSLNYHYYLARENLLNLSSETDVALARYQPGTSYLIIARYGSERDATAALFSFKEGYMPDAGQSETLMTENGKYVACRKVGTHVVLVLDAESESAADTLIQTSIERITEPTN